MKVTKILSAFPTFRDFYKKDQQQSKLKKPKNNNKNVDVSDKLKDSRIIGWA